GDARFATEHSISRALSAQPAALPLFLNKIKTNNQVQEALLRINATGSLLVELISRSIELSQIEQLANTKLLILQTRRSIDSQIEQITNLPGSLSLIQSIDAIMTFINGSDTLFDLNQNRLQHLKQGQSLLLANRELLAKLQSEISRAVADGNQRIEISTQNLLDTIRKARGLLFSAVIIGVIVVFIVVWYYVGKNLVRRLLSLNQSMQMIAAGDLDTPVDTGVVQDEISDMAISLQLFQNTLRETQNELVQAAKLAALGQLAAGIAHELNQPLSAIRSYNHNVNILLSQSRSNEALEILGKIDELVERVADMTNRFKNLARRSDTKLDAVNIKQTIDETLEFFQAKFTRDNIQLEYDYADQSLAVSADKVRLGQVLINLFQNALDAMQNSHIKKLSIDVKQSLDFITISVADSGNGLPNDELEKIFDPFYTSKEVGQGVGLGLTISYNIINDFNGSLKVIQNHMNGLTFIIKLQTWING
ncbi:MAG: HAMP domain-containing protein, partial [Desulfobacula sp.]|nr:HAMP domain-containing protein [Desulfobacula sp.]